MWNLKYDTNELICKTETDSQKQRTDLWLPREGGWGREGFEFVISRCKLSYIGWINNKILLYITGNHVQYPVINHNGKEYEKEYVCVYIYIYIKNIYKTESHCCTAEINTAL